MTDYAAIQAKAQAKVNKFGRTVTFVQLDATVPDPAQPWRGPVDPRGTPTSTLVTKGVFVALKKSLFGDNKLVSDLLKKSDKLCLVGATQDLSVYQEMIDSLDGHHYKIMSIETLSPGPVQLLFYVALQQ